MKVLLTSRTDSIWIDSGKKIGLIGVKTEENVKNDQRLSLFLLFHAILMALTP